MKILTLNMWRYYEWEKRKSELVAFLKEQDADVVLLQEVASDERIIDTWKNQAHELAVALKYPNYIYGKLMDMKKWHGKPITWHMEFGVGILSKYPIVTSERVLLPQVEKEKTFGFLHAVLRTPQGHIDCISVHYENTDKGSREQLHQTLLWCAKKRLLPIIGGDFNMKIVHDVQEIAKDYVISYDVTPYKSFYPTEHSHDKVPITLDYIIAHKKQFVMKEVLCVSNKVSDHNPVIAIIDLKKK